MIRFLNPWILNYLYMAIILGTIFFLYAYLNRRKLLKLIRTTDSIYWYIIQFLKILALILLFTSMSIPVASHIVEKYVPASPYSPEILNIVANITALHIIIIDESKSMLYTDQSNITRFEQAINFTIKYLRSLSNIDKVMIIGFAEEPRKICIGTPIFCLNKLSELEPGKEYTSISTAIGYAYTYANAAQYPAVIVIVSDGAYNKGGDPYDAIIEVNKSGYPVLFVRIGLDPRANNLILRLKESNIKTISVNDFTTNLIDELAKEASREMRIQAFIARKVLEVKVLYEEIDPTPTLALLVSSLILLLITRIEGF